MTLEPKSHCDSRTPTTGDAQSRVSVSLGSQSWAAAKADFDQTWQTALQTFAKAGNWGESKRACVTSRAMEPHGEAMY